MPLSITITDLKIDSLEIDYEQGNITVNYSLVDAENNVWKTDHAIFWANLPENPLVNWFQLPQKYIDMFVSLKNDADLALTNFIFGG